MAFYRTTAVNGTTPEEPYIELLEANVNIISEFTEAREGYGIHTFKSKTVEPDWLDTHMVLADIKNLKYTGGQSNGQNLSGGAFTWSITNDGYLQVRNAPDYDRWYGSGGSPAYQTGGRVICDFYAVKKLTT